MINSILIEVLSSIAEQERLTIRQRQSEGIAAAKEKGSHLGRPAACFPPDWEKTYSKWKVGETTAVAAMRELGLKRSTFYKLVHQYEEGVVWKKVFIVLLLARSLCLLGTGGCQLFQYWEESHQSNQVYSGLEEYVRRPDTTPDTDFYSPPSQDDEEAPILIPDIDFASLQEINPDIVGWLYCEDTPIHYPVVQGEDNSYYLKHLFDGTYNANGCLFLDSRVKNDFSEAYSIIYGHHMKKRNHVLFFRRL